MTHAPAFVNHCLELMSGLGEARARRMFSGHGLYVDEHFVALIIGDVLYLKADATAQPQFEAAGSQPFSYATAAKPVVVMAYWSAPDEAMESAEQMLPWGRLAMASALRAAAARRVAAARKPRAKPAQTRSASDTGALAAGPRKSGKH